MMLVIAEKPSVAQSIAAVLGANKRMDGYFMGDTHIVSWCVGHLVQLSAPQAYAERYAKWRRADLPILPNPWRTEICDGTRRQFEVLKRLMHDSQVDTVVCATDAGREGELIFRLVYEAAGCIKPVRRLWISSLEESAIRAGLNAMKEGCAYDPLYRAALCRAQADWLVGINATRLFSLLYGQTLNIGRVMSPTLALIVQREEAIDAFVQEPFYTVQLDCGFTAATERLADREEAERVAVQCQGQTAAVKRIECRRKTEKPPQLYDLTSLQRDANRLLGYTAQQTLDYAQSLYEKKLLTYPRTDSRFVTGEMRDALPDLARRVADAFPFMTGLNLPVTPEKVVCDGKVTDHHAILPTQATPAADLAALPVGERDILSLVSVRLLSAMGDAYVADETIITLVCAGVTFTGKGKTVVQMGWKIPVETFSGSMGGKLNREQPEPPNGIPNIKEGDCTPPVRTQVKEGRTTPPRRYTEDSLLSAMEAAGANDMPDDAERKGLGTPATRAATIEKLIQTGFVERQGNQRTRYLLPTRKGKALIAVLPEYLRSPLLTAQWEQRLKQIERGEEQAETFMRDICGLIAQLIRETKPQPEKQAWFVPDKAQIASCPRCGMAVTETDRRFSCINRACGFGLWKEHPYLKARGIQPDAQMAAALMKDGRVCVRNLRAKTGKLYDAVLIMDCADGKAPHFSMAFDQ